MELRYHPLFDRWLTELAEGDEEIFGEVMALIVALEQHGRELDDDRPNIAEAQTRLEQYARHRTDLTPIVKRGNR